MKSLFKILLLLAIFSYSLQFCSATQFANVEYTVPIDYSKIDKNALATQANQFFDNFIKITDKEYRKRYIQPLLNRYSVLSTIDPSEPLYLTRLAILYDEMGQNIYAKSYFFRATNIDPNYKYASYSFGNYYYNRGYYRRALKEYKKAVGIEYPYSYDRFVKVGSIYEKLGNYKPALNSYKAAFQEENNAELYNKILLLEDLSSKKVLYH